MLSTNGWQIKATLVVLMFAAVTVSHVGLCELTRETHFMSPATREPILLKPEVVKLFCLGHEQLAADLYWLRFIQYIGDGNARRTDRYAECLRLSKSSHYTRSSIYAALLVCGICCRQRNETAGSCKSLDRTRGFRRIRTTGTCLSLQVSINICSLTTNGSREVLPPGCQIS